MAKAQKKSNQAFGAARDRKEFLAAQAAIAEQGKAVRAAIVGLSKDLPKRAPKNWMKEQPFDGLLLNESPLYRRSRELYLSYGGEFRSLMVSTPRTLSSPTLLVPSIQYSPVESEMIWAATDPIERKNFRHLLALRTYVGSLFHEQNHRSLWNILPPPPNNAVGIRHYLNFAESLVISADVALGDQLGKKRATALYRTGTIYDPGSDIGKLKLNRREYRNYLQAATHATYLNLEHYDLDQVTRGIAALFPNLGNLSERASKRSGNLDRSFVLRTNPAWQKKHWKKVAQVLASKRKNEAPLVLPDDPMDNRLQYLLAEKWFETLGL